MQGDNDQRDLLLRKLALRVKALEQVAMQTGLCNEDKMREEVLRASIRHDQLSAELDLDFRRRLLFAAIATASSCLCEGGCSDYLLRVFSGKDPGSLTDEEVDSIFSSLPEGAGSKDEGEWLPADRELWADCWIAEEADSIVDGESVSICHQSILECPYPELNGTKAAILHASGHHDLSPSCACASCRHLASLSLLDPDHSDHGLSAETFSLPVLESQDEMFSDDELLADLLREMQEDRPVTQYPLTMPYYSFDTLGSQQGDAPLPVPPQSSDAEWLEKLFALAKSYQLASGWAFGFKRYSAEQLAKHIASHPKFKG